MSEEEDWDDSDSEEIMCDHCGKTRRCTLTVDPFLREIYPDDDNQEEWWCYQCYSYRAADI